MIAAAAVVATVAAGAPPASAAPGHAPTAPAGLTVGDRTRPLNVEGIPQFGWLPRDVDPGETQTAYRITVTTAGGDLIWDSGKVASDQQSYVPYGGPALRAGTAYEWTVRTWDRTDQPSPPGSGAFETGISDSQWEGASWIRRATTEADDYTLARTEVRPNASPVVRARAYTAADHTYELYLNGTRADRGTSFGYPGEDYYQAADVSDLVTAGEPLAIGVRYHWYGSGQGRPAGNRGLLMKLVVEHADGTREVFVTDGSWRVARDTRFVAGAERRNGEGDRVERQDARAEVTGWTRPGYDDSVAPFTAPQVVGAHPNASYPHLIGQETRLAETTVAPVALRTADDGTVVADFGVVIPARPVVRFDAGVAGRTVTLRAGYTLTDTGRVATSTLQSQGTNMSFPYLQKDGPQEFRAFTHLGFRYLEIPGADEEIALDDISAVVVHTDVPAGRDATFASSDTTLDAVWTMLKRSALYSVQEAFVDTPTREKGQFLGDAANISYATMGAFGERDATQQAIREFLRSAARYWTTGDDRGRYNAVYPNGDGKRDIPDYSLMFVDWVWRYWTQTGDRALLAEAYPAIRDTADYVQRHIPATGPTAGLVTELAGGSGAYRYGIVDWPEPGRFGYDMTAVARTTINAQGVDVLRTTARMAEALGRPAAEVAAYDGRAADLTAAMNAKLRRADGSYVDGLSATGEQSGHAGQHATSYAIAHGVAPRADLPALADHLAAMGMKQGPMTAHWLLRALADAGRPDAVLRLLTNPDDLGWANILAQGGTFTWEAWTLDPGTNFSQSHGWGSQAVVDVQESLLGVRTATPGAAVVDVVPPAVGLDHAAGTVPTQRGPVHLDWRRTGAGLTADLDVPVNVTARVALPITDGMSYRAAGPSKATFVGIQDGRAVFEVGSGRSSFHPVADTAAQPR
ncbi:glycoside hydrolase family 78 protein [Micromonospora yasonensis]|uniref:glycoside hydrolase family 78 protein n=1 Tax=Micromonospora yasonensis TaxID=1128667 RepID=UPI0022308655|nr:glycoside hydrolase family 78 protein [Micromonospora yasonensis]MCW3845000.1 glycoside hydrolase family 78 protein [Micromonospora yasonensis]